MALVNPHPALKVAAPVSPMVDGWMGDDWFHYGAFRQINFDYFTGQTDEARARAADSARRPTTTTTTSGAPASAGDFARAARPGSAAVVATSDRSTPPTTPSGRSRRSTN